MSDFKYAICASKGAGIQEPVLFRGEYMDALIFARNVGAQGIEIHLRDACDVNGEELLEQSRKQNIKIAGIATGLAKRIDGLSLVADCRLDRDAAIERVKGHLDLAHKFGCPVIIGSMRSNIPSPEADNEYRRRLKESVRILADYIEGKNCSIIFEAINRYENNYLNTAEETAEFIHGIGSGKVNMLLDLFHMNIEETNTSSALRKYRDIIGHIHIADSNRHYPGGGQMDFEGIMKTLKEIRYEGWLSLEYLPIPEEREAALKGMEFITQVEKVVNSQLMSGKEDPA